jgi:hypothetical protein
LGLGGGEIGLLFVANAESGSSGVVQLTKKAFFSGFVLQNLGVKSPGLAATCVRTAGEMSPGTKNSDAAEHQLLHGVGVIFTDDDGLLLPWDRWSAEWSQDITLGEMLPVGPHLDVGEGRLDLLAPARDGGRQSALGLLVLERVSLRRKTAKLEEKVQQ